MKVSSSNKIRLLFCGHDLKFIDLFISLCKTDLNYEVRVLEHKGHTISDEEQALKELAWADAIFCEWALGNAVWFSQHKRDDQTLIIRLHAQEIRARDRLPYIWQIDWQRVDRLILITHHLYDWMIGNFPSVRGKCSLIYNPIDACGKLNSKKDSSSCFNLGFVGMVPSLKRFDLAIDFIAELVKVDPRYKLRIKGHRPEEYAWMRSRTDEMTWYDDVYNRIETRGLTDHVIFDPHGNDMGDWYAKIGFILSLSDEEGSHQAVAEGMATGCIPIIRNWVGADRIYPPRYVHSCASHLVQQVLRLSERKKFQEESEYSRSFSASRFDIQLIATKLNATILQALRGNTKQNLKKLPMAALPALPNVLIIAYIPANSSGGYRIRVEQEVRQLVQAGCAVQLACLLQLPKPNAEEIAVGISLEDILNSHKASLQRLGCLTHIVPVTDFFKMEITDSDCKEQLDYLVSVVESVHVDVVHSEALYAARFGSLLKKRLPKVKFSIDWHGVAPEEEKMGGGHASRVAMLESTERELLKGADLNVFVSAAMSRHYNGKYGSDLAPATVVPCCVGHDQFGRDKSVGNKIITKIPEGRLIFGYAGTMVSWQCGREMIRLFAQLHDRNRDSFFLILSPKRDHEAVERYAEECGLPNASFDLREVNHAEVPQYLQLMHVGVMLRRDDPVNIVSSPTKFGEYLAAGLPVLMTEGVGDYSQAAFTKGLGLVISPSHLEQDSFPVEELDRIIAFARGVRDQGDKVKDDCRKYAFDELHWEPVVENWLRSYLALAK